MDFSKSFFPNASKKLNKLTAFKLKEFSIISFFDIFLPFSTFTDNFSIALCKKYKFSEFNLINKFRSF